ncbi:serine/threonine protein kinase [Allocoleopsis franciscana]|uniref:Serine/threonine protein kinase n=1 Tax=Allocoleopsis franciscana PCC 7113 TaxID=1173027 RepID=K9WAY6_9CYAN|nr:serine/threonine-protein kinase [Allocoleopsis franciscana]AFZ17535.1 serine/threonine protein kinase [Allocoleopsis franciscana PCC 7113]
MVQTEQILQKRYQLRQTLGHNASCQTWLAQDIRIQERVVVKLLTFCDQVQWDNVRLFEREAQVLKQLNHPKIPQYRDYFCIDDQMLWFGLVQQYIPGSSLKELLALGKTFSEQEVRAIAQQVLNILVYLHSLSPPVLHRDIKPSNLIWGTPPETKLRSNIVVEIDAGTRGRGDAETINPTEYQFPFPPYQGGAGGGFPEHEGTGEVYLVDFGAVQDRAAAEGATFTVVGTYGYAPLEQLGGRATPASDLYALGATLIHLLTGVAPADLPQQKGRIQFADRVRLNPGFVRWIEKLTEPNLSQRFRSANEALEALLENQMTSVAITHPKPSNSRIQLKKSPTQLQIRIPVRWRRALTHPKQLAVGVGLGFWLWFGGGFALRTINVNLDWLGLYLVAWLIFGILYAGWLMLPAFGETTIYFNHQFFQIEWRLLGFCLRQQRGSTLAIDQVFKSETHGLFNRKSPEVTLAVGVQEYIFGGFDPPLTHTECYWLMEEIKNWLGLR